MKNTLLYLYLFTSYFCYSQTGPAGVGTNATSVNQNRIWYKSDVGVFSNAGTTLASNGNSVQQWNDQSGVGNNGVQSTPGNRPTYLLNVANGFPALRLNGSNWITASAFPSIANNVGYTYIVVIKDTSFTAGAVGDGAGDYIIDRGPPGGEVNELAGLKVAATNKFGFQKRDGGGGGLGGPVSVTSVNTSSFQVINYRQTPGATKVYDIFVDGALEATLSNADGDYVPPVPQLGHHYQPASSGMKGYMTEFILYNYNLNGAQMNIINSYLSAKYGTSLSSNDKYAGDNVVNGNFDFEVAGVGTDASGTNLAAASSISGGLQVTQVTTMETGEYLVFGHQTGSNFINTTDISGMSSGPAVCRWNRIWYLDWTHIGGTTETVDLTFDLSDGGIPATPAAPLTNYKLLYRTGLSGSWTELAVAGSISGDRITFPGIAHTAADGYYTIGTRDNVNSTLPIGLLDFSATTCGNEVCLDWSTATETNNNYFTIERSGDGINFETIATQKGRGTSGSFAAYSAVDHKPRVGMSYYHLKQTDFDGKYSYSKIEAVNFNGLDNFKASLYPSPNKGLVEIEINMLSQVRILDASGQEVYNATLEKGKNQIDIQQIQSGMYFLKVTNDKETHTIKFMKE